MIDDVGQPERPARGEDEPWRDYWARVQPHEWFERWGFWRTEPEIDAERRAELTERRALTPDFEHGVYRFGGLALTRADVEWLLATHESADTWGPVALSDESQLGRVGLDLRGANLRGEDLSRLPLARTRGGITPQEFLLASIQRREAAAAHFEDATFVEAWLEAVSLRGTHLERAYFRGAHLEGADLTVARLDGATLSGVYLGGTRFPFTDKVIMDKRRVDKRRDIRRRRTRFLTLPSADLHGAFFDDATILIGPHVADDQGMGIRLADIRWGGANLARTDWRRLRTTGDEVWARQPYHATGTPRSEARRGYLRESAVRANRQLATALRAQGLNEQADRFAYRAQILQRVVLRRQGQWPRWAGSLMLDLIAGYGYRPLRSFVAYAVVILGFAGLYLLNAQFAAPHLRWDEALVLSVSSFHGRGVFPTGISLGDTLARLAAVEAIIGLLIEITFIATFTQRFFAR